MSPHVPGDLGAVRVHRDHFAFRDHGDLVAAQRVRPDIGLIHAQERGHLEAVPAVRDTALGDPPLHGLGVYLRSVGQLVGGLAPLEQERSQPFVAHLTGPAGRERTATP